MIRIGRRPEVEVLDMTGSSATRVTPVPPGAAARMIEDGGN